METGELVSDVAHLIDSMVEDGHTLLGSKEMDIWKLHTKVGEERILWQSKEIKTIQPNLKLMKLKNTIWKMDIIMKNID